MPTPLIDATVLLEIYQQHQDLILLDARSGADAKAKYKISHLKDAYWIDLNADLAAIKEDASNGGRHPLPSIEVFAETVANFGISENTYVVVYDDKSGANAAARCWWMLKALGHEKVAVLNGGISAAEKAGYPMSTGVESSSKKSSPLHTNEWNLPVSNIDEVKEYSKHPKHLVIDVRESYRYRGESEPIDLVAGHIPGAINVPYISNLDEDGLFHSPTVLKEKYESVLGEISAENVIVHCGSGVTACHTILAMAHAGMSIPKLYVGSWSEWSRRTDYPRA